MLLHCFSYARRTSLFSHSMQLQQAEGGSASQQPKIQDTYAEKINKVLKSKNLFKIAFRKISVCVLEPLSQPRGRIDSNL